jgi:hypothetical protein
MKGLTHLFIGVLVAVLMLAVSAQTVIAQEKAKAEKATPAGGKEKIAAPAKVLVENEKFRVVESRIKPGEKNEMKMRNDRVIVPLKDAKVRIHGPDGKTEDSAYKAGEAVFRKQGKTQTENIGKTETRNIVVTSQEPKK